MTQIKLFTVGQAEKALPLVSRIVADIVRSVLAREESVVARQKLAVQPNPGSNTEERAFALEREILQCEEDVTRYQLELDSIGVEIKDYRIGLIDFYSQYNGRVVYLCWKLGEGPVLEWWHDLKGGFRGRQPITPEIRDAFKASDADEKWVDFSKTNQD